MDGLLSTGPIPSSLLKKIVIRRVKESIRLYFMFYIFIWFSVVVEFKCFQVVPETDNLCAEGVSQLNDSAPM